MRIRELLKNKGNESCTIAHCLTVEDAIALMDERKISALVVAEEESPVGIFTKEDVLRCYLRGEGRPFKEIRIDMAMTNKLITAEPEDEVAASMSMMIQAGIGHLPVIEEGRIIGMLSFRDMVHHQVEALTAEINHLQEYIDNLHEAARD